MSGMVRSGVALVLGLVIIAAAGALGYQAIHRDGAPWTTTNPAQQARDAVTGQARAFMKRINTYGPDLVEGTTMPTYRSGVKELVTAAFNVSFVKNVPYAEATVTQAGLDRATTVQAAGVADLDMTRGRATVLVAGELTNSFPDPQAPGDRTRRQAGEPQPYRVEVSLVRQSGRGKVDNFTPVGASGQQQVEP